MGERVFEKLSSPPGLHDAPILVFAGDALAAGGLRGLGRVVENGRPRPRRHPEFLQLCRDLSKDGFIDGCLLTPADAETLAVEERLFDALPVTPLVRLNAETSIWSPRHGQYGRQAAQPFQTVTIKAQAPEAAYCSTIGNALECHVRMGLYSITLNNDVDADRRTLMAYLEFAREVGDHPQFEHFLEVFLPNMNLPGMDTEKRGQYVADSIVRTMSYLKKHQRPRFIKTEFTSATTWRELCDFDPTLIVGALGGPRINARKTLELAYNVVTNGGRAALFGRTIFDDENPRAMCQALRAVLDHKMSVEQAYAAYQKGF
ncbi:MAG: hypothetical protein JO316_19280 [Abitibacteriaceae bacterium]|nr:hypothetical protein [Abditibacteriaceae bacterium]MBV9867501.1 hypothetical protein [Abditibacteriaceae bacterium]